MKFKFLKHYWERLGETIGILIILYFVSLFTAYLFDIVLRWAFTPPYDGTRETILVASVMLLAMGYSYLRDRED